MKSQAITTTPTTKTPRSRAYSPIGPRKLDDNELLDAIKELVRSSNRTEGSLIGHLAELENRGLCSKRAAGDLFTYCKNELKMSESQSYRRSTAAKAALEFPVLLDKVAAGALHLSAILALKPLLTEQNHAELIAACEFKSHREIKKILAERFEKPKLPETVRKLPPVKPPADPQLTPRGQDSKSKNQAPSKPAPVSTPAPRPLIPNTRPQVDPWNASTFKVVFTINEACHAKLQEAVDLLGPRAKGQALAMVFSRGLDAMLAELKKKKHGITSKPRRAPSQGSDVAQTPDRTSRVPGEKNTDAAFDRQVEDAGNTQRLGHTQSAPTTRKAETPKAETPKAETPKAETPKTAVKPDPAATFSLESAAKPVCRTIPNAVRREVYQRDGGQCAFVDSDGHRCSQRWGLEYHHILPFARGGAHSVANLELRCRAHNLEAAERDFGRKTMARFRRRVDQTAPATPVPGQADVLGDIGSPSKLDLERNEVQEVVDAADTPCAFCGTVFRDVANSHGEHPRTSCV